MTDAAAPFLVHNRIDRNRTNSRLLVLCLAAFVLPMAWALGYLAASLLHPPNGGAFLPTFEPDPRAKVLSLWIAILGTIVVISVAYLTSLTTSLILWRSSARPLGRNAPELRRLVENLCIGAGMPPPALYMTDSSVPNAFAVGYDAKSARLVVSRGLLALLDRRELAGVVAHELSHIANRDTHLSTLVAAFATAMRIPQALFTSLFTFVPRFGERAGVIPLFLWTFITWLLIVVVAGESLGLVLAISGGEGMGPAFVVLAPIYVLVLAPAMGALLRTGVSREREFLADADAVLLTRDPEGLALALAKVSAALDPAFPRDPAMAHLFFIDPAPPAHTSWLGGVFSTHPSPDERIAVLTRMGDGHVEGLDAAFDAGVDYRGEALLRQYAPPNERAGASAAPGDALTHYNPGARVRLIDERTPLYRSPDRMSAVMADLDGGVEVDIISVDAGFYRVRTADGESGYLDRTAGAAPCDADNGSDTRSLAGIHYRLAVMGPGFAEGCRPGARFRLTEPETPLYEKPDGWSTTVRHLAAGFVVTIIGVEGNFVHVQTDAGDGYIPRVATAEHVSG